MVQRFKKLVKLLVNNNIKGEFILHIYLLGATGRVGNNILNTALNDGHQFSVLTRSREKLKIKSPLLTIYEGDVLNKADLLHSMKDCDVVISALNTDKNNTLSRSMP